MTITKPEELDRLVFTYLGVPYILFRDGADMYRCYSFTFNGTDKGTPKAASSLLLYFNENTYIPQFNMVDVCKEVF